MASKHEVMSDRELLIRIDERTEAADERLDNHGKRIGSLEKWKWGLTAIFAFIGFVIMYFENIRTILK